MTPGSEGSTFGGYPLASVVSVYAIKVLVEDELAENAQIRGDQLLGILKHIQELYPHKIMEVRGKGLLTAFEMFPEKHLDGHHVSLELLKRGVYVKETHHSTVRIAPALTINAEQIDQIGSCVEDVIKNI